MTYTSPSSSRAVVPGDVAYGERWTFLILFALYGIIVFPILRADEYYNDDIKRALFGRASWDSNGRPLTTFLMRALQAYDHAMVDISPLTQIGAVAVLAWAGVLIARRFAIRSPWMAALATLPLGAQPFYLGNLSFKFDALSMSLAILLALVPVVLDQDTVRRWWLGVLALFASLNFYQPAIDVYLVFAFMEIVHAQVEDAPPRTLARMALSRFLQTLVTMAAYEVTVGIHISGWVKKAATPIHAGQWQQFYLNYLDFYRFVGASLDAHWWTVYAPILLLLGLTPVAVGLRYAAGQRSKIGSFAVVVLAVIALLVPLIASVLALGPMLVLASPEISARVLMGIGALLVMSLVVMHASFEKWGRSPRWFGVAACALALGMASLASAYGNALNEQRLYESRIGARLADDLAQLKATRGIDSLLIEGSDGYAPVTAHVIGQIPLVRSLITPYIAGGAAFQTNSFLDLYVQGITNLSAQADPASAQAHERLLARLGSTGPVVTTSTYRLYVVDRTAVLRFD
ncbi:MAG TPA: glucosyltransferase domain-containing protein [Frateuria sp.]|uniref:glucosyltransferase domain-containing protein n=1 Tax=Frateuria sp. TaxID=2211372 RepID=UPI002DED8047|nr:glucosyltransferase domain-containing protein [Frateuria sp.]